MLKDKWSEYKFVECLGILPDIDLNREEWHRYKLPKDNLILELDISAYRDLVCISLTREFDEEPFFSFFLFVKGNVTYINEKSVSYLKLEKCVVSTDEYSYPDFSDDLNFEVHVYPKLKLRYS